MDVPAPVCTHNRLITYVDEKYDVSIIKKLETSKLWGG